MYYAILTDKENKCVYILRFVSPEGRLLACIDANKHGADMDAIPPRHTLVQKALRKHERGHTFPIRIEEHE